MTPSDRERSRAAGQLPEEQVTGTEDSEAQAAAILQESDERQLDPHEPAAGIEHRTSDEATGPTE